MEKAPGTTRSKLIAAAERLFAEKGIDAVSLREINRAAGARNAVAVQYHFDDRAGIIAAVLAKHRPDIEARRHAMLDQIEAERSGDLRAFAAALVRPSAAKLADTEGGREYLQIHAELVNRTSGSGSHAGDEENDSIERWRTMVAPHLDEEAVRLHRRFSAIRFAATELGRRAGTGPHTDDRLFVSHLIDLVTAVLAAPVSDETVRLADERDRALAGERGRQSA